MLPFSPALEMGGNLRYLNIEVSDISENSQKSSYKCCYYLLSGRILFLL